ncbi:META domain-containing protein [Cellulomonas sp. P5_E12]
MSTPRAAVARIALLVALGGAALAACSSSEDSSGATLESSDVVGTWSQTDTEPPVDLELMEDGTVSGSDGCNQLNGTWKIDGSEVEFGPFAATMMACEDVNTWLSAATSANVDGEEMTVYNEDHKEIGALFKE